MWNKWYPVLLIGSAAVFTCVDMARLYPLLPDNIASHFNAAGVPDGWSTKQEFVWFGGGTFLGLGLLMGVLPVLMRILPPSLINLPDKEYWLGQDQRDATFQFFTTWSRWFAALTLWLLAIVFHAALVANLKQPAQLSPLWSLLGVYLLSTVVLLIALVRRFRRTSDSTAS
jgi:uncharacterized membrane protein